VPSLQRVVAGGSSDAARTAVGALRATGAAGMEALNEIADSHPDESVRMTARIALGRPIGHMH
jgi:HEAT repeat protein